MRLRKRENRVAWDVPYLPIDPRDVGRSYEAIVVINSQSGKGGAAFILEQYGNFSIPKLMQAEVGRVVQKKADFLKRTLDHDEIISSFREEFVNREDRIILLEMTPKRNKTANISLEARLKIDGKEIVALEEEGDGVIDALSRILSKSGFIFHLGTYEQHAIGEGSEATAVAYIGIEYEDDKMRFGVGVDTDISWAGANALISAVNRAFKT
jgi:2-isopropylmalate synthase